MQPDFRMHLEVHDLENAIKAMRADPRCNGFVAVVGGSAGAALTIMASLDTSPSVDDNGQPVWPFWFQDGNDDRPNCAVMLSAVYDFADWTPPQGETETDPVFLHNGLHNFALPTQSMFDTSDFASLPFNPVNLVPGAIAHGWKPIYMFNSYHDHPTAYHQLVRMVCVLQSQGLVLGTDYKYLTIPGEQHAFEYWNSWDHHSSNPKLTIGADVIAFLKAQAGLP